MFRSPLLSVPFKVLPRDIGQALGELGAEVYNERLTGLVAFREPDFRVLEHLIGPRERGVGDILSYIFFDRSFIDAAIELGIEHASAVTAGTDPWTSGAAARPARA